MYVLPALVVCLILQTPSPTVKPENPVVKNKTTNQKTDAVQKYKRAEPSQTVAVRPQESATKTNPTKSEDQSNSQKGIYLVHEISPPDPKDPPLFLPYLIATILGVAVNAVILFLIWRQTEINWRQVKVAIRTARAAEASARSAQKSADVLIASQRPQISAKPNGNPGKDFCSPKGQHIKIDVYNTGLTIAYDCVCETWLEVFPEPFVDFTENAEYSKRLNTFSLYPKDKPVTVNIPIEKMLSPERIRAIMQHQMFLGNLD
jgi:hypothetical protein